MASPFFSTLMSDSETRQRSGGVSGLRYAEIKEKGDKGYILKWLSGPVRTLSAPARAAAFMAGKERGAYFPFEVGDEVLVGFIDGHIDQPVILGALWSEGDPVPPKTDESASNNTRVIHSRAGARLAFDDTKGATSLTLESASGMKIVFDDKKKTLTLQFSAQNKIELSAKGVAVTGTVINLN